MLEAVSRMLGLDDPFRRIEDAGAKVGVVDIGSNSVRLVVFDSATRSPAVFFNEKVLCGLGEDLHRTGRLSDEGKRLARETLTRFKALADRMQLDVLEAVGTAALRVAEDGPAFVDWASRELGMPIRVASGPDEARLSAQGVLVGDPEANGVVADIGGASLELVPIAAGTAGNGVTAPLGPLVLKEAAQEGPKALDKRIDKILDATLDGSEVAAAMASARAAAAPGGPRRRAALHMVGGAWRALVKAHMEHTEYPLRVLHGFSLDAAQAHEMAEWGAAQSAESIKRLTGSSERRSAGVPLAARVLARILARLRPDALVLSAFGLREGVLWEHLPDALRRQDPLIHACHALERSYARLPGFGDEVWAWLRPIFPQLSEAEARLARAACLICDASWRTHPDYRAQSCFELVTRNNFGGVDHADRAFIGAALLYRYKGGRKGVRTQPGVELLSEETLMTAEALGRGIRLGAMLAAAAPGVLLYCPLNRLGEGPGAPITLRLPGPFAALKGDEVRKRLEAFGEALGAERATLKIEL